MSSSTRWLAVWIGLPAVIGVGVWIVLGGAHVSAAAMAVVVACLLFWR